MNPLPDALRMQLGSLRVCRANGITPRVLLPETAAPWLTRLEERGGSIETTEDLRERALAFGRRLIDASFHVHADLAHAPETFSCSTLVRYVFASIGIWMPRYAIDQSYCGTEIQVPELPVGALVFWRSEFPIHDGTRVIGHVGMANDEGGVLHAGSKQEKVHEFVPSVRPRLAIDPFPAQPQLLVHLPGNRRSLETALDIVRWLQR